jgi:hypothetical protein
MCGDSFQPIFSKVFTFLDKHPFLWPTNGGMWRILNSYHNFWKEIIGMGLCYMKTSFPLYVVGLHLFPITILAGCHFFLEIWGFVELCAIGWHYNANTFFWVDFLKTYAYYSTLEKPKVKSYKPFLACWLSQ